MLSTLDTTRLVIRPLRLDDVSSIHQLYADIDWADRSADEPTNLARRRSWVEWSIRNYEQLARLNQPPYGERAVVLKDREATFAGLIGLVPLLAPSVSCQASAASKARATLPRRAVLGDLAGAARQGVRRRMRIPADVITHSART
jgi:hypothetical protein